MSRDPDAALTALAEHLDPDLRRRLLVLLSAEHGAAAVIEAQREAQHQADVVAEIRRQMTSLVRQNDALENGSWFVLTEEPYHDNSILIGVGRSQHHARVLLSRHRAAMGLRGDVPYDAWEDCLVSPTGREGETGWHASLDGDAYQIQQWRGGSP